MLFPHSPFQGSSAIQKQHASQPPMQSRHVVLTTVGSVSQNQPFRERHVFGSEDSQQGLYNHRVKTETASLSQSLHISKTSLSGFVVVQMSNSQRLRPNPPSHGADSGGDSGILNERILLLIFESIKWDLHILCLTASVNRKLRAIAKRLLWRELCVYRAPRMVSALANGSPNGRIGGGWHALAKLMFYCCGCVSTQHFKASRPCPGHFSKASRFSKTSGRSFLTKKCRGDLLYVSDPCEHSMGSDEDDLGIYRGVFKSFMRSKTRAYLIGRRMDFEDRVRCPYCGSRVWSMTTARLVPKSAARRLGTHEGGLEYFVCVNGHLHGTCSLLPLSSDEGERGEEDDDMDDDDAAADEEDFDGDDVVNGFRYDNHAVNDGSTSSMGEDLVVDGPAN